MIPRVLHQTWRVAQIPRPLRAYHDSWRHHHPHWEFRLWTDADNESLVADHYPDYLAYYRNVLPPILKVDFARLAYLHRHGGVYADLDYQALRPFDPLLDTPDAVLAREHDGIGMVLRGRDYVINALMASPAGHPLWLDTMGAMVSSFRPRRWLEQRTAYVIRMAIEVLDQQVERRLQTHHDVTVLPFDQLYPSAPTDRIRAQRTRRAAALSAYGIHHYQNSWRSPVARLANAVRAVIQRCGRP